MRFSIIVSILCFGLITLPIQAQIVEGKVGYKIEASIDNPDVTEEVLMLQGSTMDIYFIPKHARTVFVLGTMMQMVSVIDEDKGEVLTLMSGMIGKKAMRSTLDEMDNEILELSNPIVRLVDEKKEIAGINCSKAILIDSTGKETVIWYTPDIQMSARGQSFFNNHFPGFPLEFSTEKNGALLTMSAYEVKSGLSNSEKEQLFEMHVPEGYEEMPK
jgi:hypothetical protein